VHVLQGGFVVLKFYRHDVVVLWFCGFMVCWFVGLLVLSAELRHRRGKTGFMILWMRAFVASFFSPRSICRSLRRYVCNRRANAE
ncbi:MAG TPA: hypothetical protein PK198_26050, partial [Saprospiraceae bacterium]|nr:hypothetical protein [Saprospiraceae bacterium]